MRVVLYIAVTLDGFIADSDGGVGFLDAFQSPDEDFGYDRFLSTVDTVIMGRKTYAKTLTFGPWPYGERRAVVLTRGALVDLPSPRIHAFAGDVSELVDDLRAAGANRAWLVGGGEVVRDFVDADLVDEYMIFTVPRLLGSGIPLFPSSSRGLRALTLTKSETFACGLVGLHYRRQETPPA
jgi:dihydrofolate reductase